jgi:hypothetical protein
MFTRVNAKQEQFLILLVEGQSAARAYAQVYDPAMSLPVAAACASRMLTKAKVQARQSELIEARLAAQPITVQYLTREALATVGEARALGQGSAALQGYQFVAKLHGLLVDKVQADVLVRKPSASPESPDDMDAQDWLNQYASTKLIEQKTTDAVEPNIEPIVDGPDDGALHD